MLDNLKKYDVVLASNSPRRKELLQRLGIPFKVRNLFGVDESYPSTMTDGEEIASFIAKKKAEAYRSSMSPSELIIAADTTVYFNGEELGKPANAQDAENMLHKLSGNTHQVITGVAILTAEKVDSFAVMTNVKFAKLTDEEIHYYVSNYLPFDKAGSYGIQEWIGLIAVEQLEGSFFNVMGLPVQRLYNHLKDF